VRIGISYDLREDYLAQGYSKEETAEFDRPDTIRAIASSLAALGHQPDPIGNVRQLAARLVAGERWDLVFNIAEGLKGYGRESQVPALLEAYDIPYTFSDTLTLALSLHKGQCKRVIRDCGIPTPDFAVVESVADIAGIDLPFPLFAKPVAEGTGKGIGPDSKVSNAAQLAKLCAGLLERYRQPVLVETFLPGREFTVGIVGTGHDARVLGSIEVVLNDQAEPDAYGYENKAQFEGRVEYTLVEDGPLSKCMEEVALAAWRALACRDAGRMDLRLDAKGFPNFIEVNPLAGINPEISDLAILCRLKGIEYTALIGMILESALKRV
jgi:D-alanine-D-alanine ligase